MAKSKRSAKLLEIDVLRPIKSLSIITILPFNRQRVKKTVQTIRKSKGENRLAAITAYDTLMGGLASRAGMDIILVGDSVGNTVLGHPSTVEVTLDVMVHHTAAVSRAEPDSLLVADLPFALAHLGKEEVLRHCARLLQEGRAQAVKIEGDAALEPTLSHIIGAGIPVMGHIGLLPQRVNALGGYRKFGRSKAERDALLEDATAMERAGCFALIGEMIDPAVAAEITQTVKIPHIGIGSGPECDGQILVCTDMLGFQSKFHPSFVKTYANLEESILEAFGNYAHEVRERQFPQ